jgi:CHASE2 domain-containing sensor protein/GGDEF domain-containing protein
VNAKTLSRPKASRYLFGISAAKRLRAALWPAVLVFAMVLTVRWLGWTELLSLKLYNAFNQSIAQEGPSEEIVIVAFSENDFKLSPTYPYNDALLAKILGAVVGGQPRTILLNIVREQAVEPGHSELLTLYQNTPNLIGIVAWDNGPLSKMMAPPVLRERDDFGFTVAPEDSDLVARLHVLAFADADQYVRSTAILATQRFLAAEPSVPIPTMLKNGDLQIGTKTFNAIKSFAWEYRQVWPDDVQMHLLAQRHRKIARIVSFGELLSGAFDRSVLRDRLVIIGTTAPTMVKYKRTPLTQTNSDGLAAVEFTAMQIDNLIGAARGDVAVLQALPRWLELVLLALLALISCALFLRFRTLLAWFLCSLFGLLVLLGFGWLAFRAGWLLPTVPLALTVLLAFAVVIQNVLRNASLQRQMVDLMRVLIDKLPDPIYVLGNDQRIRLVNASFCRIAMATPEELIGLALDDIFPATDAVDAPSSICRGILQARDSSERTVQATVTRHESSGGQKLRVGVITATSAARSSSAVDVEQQLTKRLEVNAYLAKVLHQQASFVLITIADFAVFIAAHGSDLAPLIEDAVATRLTQTFGEGAAISVLGGGCFVALTLDVHSDQLSTELQDKITSAFSWPVEVLGASYELDLQYGYSRVSAAPETVAELLANARAQLHDLLLDHRIAHLLPAVAKLREANSE